MSELFPEVTSTNERRRKVGIKAPRKKPTHCSKCKKAFPPEQMQRNGYCTPCAAEYGRNWNHKNRERWLANHKKSYRKHRQKNLDWARTHGQKLRNLVLDHYGRSCACCGESHVEFLAIDHVNNDGCAHRRQLYGKNKSGSNFYRWLRDHNFPEGFQTLCHNCNMAKGLYGYCPHAAERMNR